MRQLKLKEVLTQKNQEQQMLKDNVKLFQQNIAKEKHRIQ